jgi:pyruvate/2-oxoglutarate dehydrogenase complex dihydrolipoamide acyltransferase (E2) component
MDTPQGLVVPNIKDVQLKSVLDIAQDLNRLQVHFLELICQQLRVRAV